MNLLYVHIPFCAVKCDYCDFYSIPLSDSTATAMLVEKLLLQLRRDQEFVGIDHFDTVYIGGGTPSVLPLQDLERLIDGISTTIAAPPAEWTIEANPSSLDYDRLRLLEQSPVDRISLGIQSLCPASMNFLGRQGTVEQSIRSLELLDKNWTGTLSVDFIRALPAEVSLSFEDELATLPALPDHLSVYDLILEAGTPLFARADVSKLESNGSEMVPDILGSLGYHQYEVSNYARPGRESLHNNGYWEMEPYLGLGPGAVSLQNLAAGWARREAAPEFDEYICADRASDTGFLPISFEDFFMDHLIMGFRQRRGLNLDLILSRFGQEFGKLLPEIFEKGLASGSLKLENRRLRLQGEAYWFQNSFLVSAWQELEQRNCFA